LVARRRAAGSRCGGFRVAAGPVAAAGASKLFAGGLCGVAVVRRGLSASEVCFAAQPQRRQGGSPGCGLRPACV